MAKQNRKVARDDDSSATRAPQGGAADGMEAHVLAFAKQVGFVAGTIQMKTEGWMDPETLRRQLAGVRDSATQLLDQLGKATGRARKAKRPSRAARKTTSPRSGGVVDAPGKKHRKRAPSDPVARLARTQASKAQRAVPLEKRLTYRTRG